MTKDTSSDNPLSGDLLEGSKRIAEFFGMPERKAYHLASKGHLPGVFKMGKGLFLSKSAAREAIAKKARGEVA